MDNQELIEQLGYIIEDYLKARGLELIDLILRCEGRDLFLRILTDRPNGGITLDECSSVNIDLSRILDEKDIVRQNHILEVSSPGIDRPLKSRSDFLRRLGRKAVFFLAEPIRGKIQWEGFIKEVGGNAVFVDINTQVIEIPFQIINKAKQILDM